MGGSTVQAKSKNFENEDGRIASGAEAGGRGEEHQVSSGSLVVWWPLPGGC